MHDYSEEDDDYFDPDELCEELQEGLRNRSIKASADIPQEQSPPLNINATVGRCWNYCIFIYSLNLFIYLYV